MSGGTAQPDFVTMWQALRGTEFDLGLDIDKVLEAEAVFKDCMADYFMPPEAKAVEPVIPFSPMPGGALTANTQMMRDNNMLDRYPEVIAAMREVVARGGFGIGNAGVPVLFSASIQQRHYGAVEAIADGYGKMVLGYLERPLDRRTEIVAIAAKQLGLEPTSRDQGDRDEDPTKGRGPATSA